MTTKYEVGNVITGKVTGIQPYGAFIALDDETQGLVHISEITHGYVKDIHEFLKIGDEVNVKVMSIDEGEGKISLSIRALEEPKIQMVQKQTRRRQGSVKPEIDSDSASGFNTLKEKLEEWIEQQSKANDTIKR
ncbi:general stress protein 13 [Oikeobacillus pervagus]|uniref:General stress protein 13 n=1 Tax=Oikeobacillus pervagus TaxID=1325931 RepID=A0AAJ1WHR7_9BACI|nr:S1 domain-containing post-transcriptional regulator GSP13 [Oikeobacillus pervagus]MDQ0216497.1 general stress protein 13 [Oikeobacillus pervagus]